MSEKVIFKLESGMTILTNNGSRYLVVLTERTQQIWAVSPSGSHLGSVKGAKGIAGITESNSLPNDPFGVKYVYSNSSPFFSSILCDSHMVWSRIEYDKFNAVVEITLEEIAEKFNINVDKLRIKD